MDTTPDRLTHDDVLETSGRGFRVVVATVLVLLLAGGVAVGAARLLTAGAPDPANGPGAAGPAGTTAAATAAAGPRTPAPDRPLRASGRGLAGHAFGTAADTVVDDLSARLGPPDVADGPTAYHRVRGQRGWFEVAGDPISPSWRHRVVSVTCWDTLCVVAGGPRPSALTLRGWELGTYVRWSPTGDAADSRAPDVRLARTGVRLGDPWRAVAAAYPGTTVGGGEGASLTGRDLPWPAISDGVGDWRLSGVWDPDRPTRAPRDAVVTRLSAGEGPEPGCC